MTVSEATLKIRVFNFPQNQIIYLSRGDSLGVPVGTPFAGAAYPGTPPLCSGVLKIGVPNRDAHLLILPLVHVLDKWTIMTHRFFCYLCKKIGNEDTLSL